MNNVKKSHTLAAIIGLMAGFVGAIAFVLIIKKRMSKLESDDAVFDIEDFVI